VDGSAALARNTRIASYPTRRADGGMEASIMRSL
jgi:hypothetical protein